MNVVEFPSRQPEGEQVLICPCGCSTFRIIVSSRELECSVCRRRLSDDVTAIAYDAVRTAEKPEAVRSVNDYGAEDLAFYATLRKARFGETSALAICNDDGMVYAWSSGTGGDPEVAAWLRTRIADLDAMWVK